jgi:hypothetical protein
MTPDNKAMLVPRLVAGFGVIAVSAAFLLPMDELLRAYAQLAGGTVAMVGTIWLLIVQRRARLANDQVNRRP